jgi:hypothetical protein
MKRSPIKRRGHKDPVSPELRAAVLERDGGECQAFWVAKLADLPYEGECSGQLTLDHVRDQPMAGKRAPSDMAHLVTLCWHHHLDGWATSHRPELRDYLKTFQALAAFSPEEEHPV